MASAASFCAGVMLCAIALSCTGDRGTVEVVSKAAMRALEDCATCGGGSAAIMLLRLAGTTAAALLALQGLRAAGAGGAFRRNGGVSAELVVAVAITITRAVAITVIITAGGVMVGVGPERSLLSEAGARGAIFPVGWARTVGVSLALASLAISGGAELGRPDTAGLDAEAAGKEKRA